MQNETAILKQKLETEASLAFQKLSNTAGTISWVCFDGASIVAIDRTLGKCIYKAAKEVGE